VKYVNLEDWLSSKLFGLINRKTLDIPEKATQRILGDKYLDTLYRNELNLIFGAITSISQKNIVEIGAAGGNTKEIYPNVVTTDVRPAIGVDLLMSAEEFKFDDESLDAIFGLDAFHHVRDPEKHLNEVLRVLRIGGNAIYIEPNWNLFSKFCFKILLKYLHPEPYDTQVKKWELENIDPMMGNQSQAHNIFVRDIDKFNFLFPNLQVEILDSIKGLSFLLSGGVHTRLPIPSRFLLAIYKFEERNPVFLSKFALGRLIRLTKVSVPSK
jgi:SAM-dependent methyltransferase